MRVDKTGQNHGATVTPAASGGYALYLVLLVMTIAGILFSVTLAGMRSTHIQSIRLLQRTQAQLLAESGVARLEYFFNGGDGRDITWETEEYQEQVEDFGSILLSSVRFGVYSRFVSTGQRLNVSRTVSGLAGRNVPRELEPVLTLTGHIGGLVLAEGATVKGSVVLHHGQVKRDNNRNVIYGSGAWTLAKACPALPFNAQPIEDFIAGCRALLEKAPADTAAIRASITLDRANDSVLTREPLFVLGDCEVRDPGVKKGLIVATGTVRIVNSTECTGIGFVCGRLEVGGGNTSRCLFFSPAPVRLTAGRHSSQFISTDSVFVDRAVALASPSVLVSRQRLRPDSTLGGGIVLAEGLKMKGTVIAYADSLEIAAARKFSNAIVLGKECVINGHVITNGDVDVQDVSMRGSLYARSISTVRNRMPSRNWLFGCHIETAGEKVMFPLIGEGPVLVRVRVGD